MFTFTHNQSALRRMGLAVSAISLLAVLSTSTSAIGQTSYKKKALSLSAVTIIDGTSANGMPLWVALGQGYFNKLGLNVTLLTSGSGSANTVAILLSGSGQFLQLSAGAQMLAAEAGGPIRGLLQTSTSEPQGLAPTTAFANAHHIPLTANTPKAALAQFMAFKGTHVNIAVSNSAATGYGWVLGMAAQHGLTVGFTAGSSADFNFVADGSPANEVAAFAAGKVDGFSNSPPTTFVTSQPNIRMPIYKIKPADETAAAYFSTTISMISQHPDTVQAAVTAMEEGALYVKTHPKNAESTASPYMASALGITDPGEQQQLFSEAYKPFDINPYPTRKGFNTEVNFLNQGNPTPITVPFTSMVVTRFAAAANKQLHIPIVK